MRSIWSWDLYTRCVLLCDASLTAGVGERVMFPIEAFSSSMVAFCWCVPLLVCTGLIWTWNFRGSSSSSESLDE